MKILDREIKLVIFDLDGTLINSTSLWNDIDVEFFKRRNMEVPKYYSKEIAHIGLEKASILTSEKYLPNEKPNDILNEWLQMSYEAYANHISLKEGAKELLDLFLSNNLKMALATANSKDLYAPCLNRLGISNYFEVIEDTKLYKHGKGSSEIYDKIRERYGFNKEETLIVEDLLEPLKTAFLSGYFVIGIYDAFSVKDVNENRKYSHLYLSSFFELLNLLSK